jgi:hypothetical protein
MGVKKTMNTFFEGMQSGLPSKTGGKIINTAMGPFQWDDLQESWVNVNNGFRLPNISMQDLLLIGYETLGGDDGSRIVCVYQTDIYNSGNEEILTFDEPLENDVESFPDANTTLSGNNCPLSIGFSLFYGLTGVSFSGVNQYEFAYTTNNSTYTIITDTTDLPFDNLTIGPTGLRLRIRALDDYASWGNTADPTINIVNKSNNNEVIAKFRVDVNV